MKRKRGNGAGTLIRREGRGPWIARYQDERGKRKERSTRTFSKKAAEQILRKYVNDVSLRREGVINTEADDLLKQGRTPIRGHLDDYETHLKDRTSDAHVKTAVARIRKIVEAGGIHMLADMKPAAVERALADLRLELGFSDETRNKYATAARAFGRWLVKQGRVARHPLPHLDRLPVAQEEHRRALTPEEARRLLATTEQGEEQRGLTRKGQGLARAGRDVPAEEVRWCLSAPARSLLYRFTLETALRRGAIERLRVADFDLGAAPTVTVQAKVKTKSKKRQTIPLRRETADLLSEHLRGRLPATQAFDMPQPCETARMLRADLEAARGAWIADGADAGERAKRADSDYLAAEDHQGRSVDFHALRTTCATWLDAAGVSASLATRITGHADVATLQKHYHRADLAATRGAVELLPSLAPTGTDGPTPPPTPPSTVGGGSEGQRGPLRFVGNSPQKDRRRLLLKSKGGL